MKEEYSFCNMSSLLSKRTESDEAKHVEVEKVYKKLFNIFKEFDEAPRISGDLVVELEDVLEENKDIIPVSKDEVMKLVEAWRRYKMEERLV